jgi:hypothetical protein
MSTQRMRDIGIQIVVSGSPRDRHLLADSGVNRLTAVPRSQHYCVFMETRHPVSEPQERIREAASFIRAAMYLTAFTGAGVSVESGIPPFRGEGGLWSRYDPRMLELDYFLAHPDTAWPVIREILYANFGRAKPNKAHVVLAAACSKPSSQRASTPGV